MGVHGRGLARHVAGGRAAARRAVDRLGRAAPRGGRRRVRELPATLRWMNPIELADDARVLVLTGAGISAESGVPTFRGIGGLWEGHRVEEVASPDAFARDPALVWRFYSQRRAGLDGIVPNPGHHAVAALERRLGDRFLLVTQNVDGLHAGAGSRRIIELHGNIMKSRCSSCDRPPFEDRSVYTELPPCDQCGELLRPHIVWFGEMIDPEHLAAIGAFLRKPGP